MTVLKIEKLNDNQIRCTLTSADLANRKIKLSELAYGTEKARNLFQDMMVEANAQFGFNYDNAPLMVEAIPVAPDSIVLIITKVDDPQELDTRFSKFAPSSDDENAEPVQYSGADDIIDLFQKLYEARAKAADRKKTADTEKSPETPTEESPEASAPVDLVRAFQFYTLDEVIASAGALNHFFSGKISLYKVEPQNCYQLILHQSGCSPEDFNKICTILSEYGRQKAFSGIGEAALMEHSEVLIRDTALQQLSGLA